MSSQVHPAMSFSGDCHPITPILPLMSLNLSHLSGRGCSFPDQQQVFSIGPLISKSDVPLHRAAQLPVQPTKMIKAGTKHYSNAISRFVDFPPTPDNFEDEIFDKISLISQKEHPSVQNGDKKAPQDQKVPVIINSDSCRCPQSSCSCSQSQSYVSPNGNQNSFFQNNPSCLKSDNLPSIPPPPLNKNR